MNVRKKALPTHTLLCFLILALSGCFHHVKYHAPDLKLSEDKTKDLFFSGTSTKTKPAPRATPPRPLSKLEKPVSLTLSPQTPLKDVLITLADQARVNIAVDPSVPNNKGVTYRASKQPLIQAISQICRLSHLRYDVEGDNLFIAEDKPYLKTYDIQFLVGSRKTENSLSVATEMNHKTSQTSQTNSNTTISSVSSVNFWDELKRGVNMILNLSRSPQDKASEKAGAKSERFALHQQAGLLSVYGHQKQHNLIRNYLTRLKKLIHTQVLIEAKIVEVNLNESYSTGINWNYLSQKLASQGQFGMGTPFVGQTMTQDGAGSISVHNGGLDAAMGFMEMFGTTRTIANPRLTVLNNQSAIFKSAKNEVFFTVQTERIFSDNRRDYETVSSQVQTVPVGLVMTVQPSINPNSQDVTLFIRPSISRVIDTKKDPAVTIKSGRVVSEVPVIQVTEMDSMVKIKPKQVVVIGGLIEKIKKNVSEGVPGLRKTWLGKIIGKKEDAEELRELVIFITVRLINHDTPMEEKEERLYHEL
ncbi:type II secretion system protein GspD [Candidatus Hepatobacter penaei]|uniref:type II secretion system protein GspD n=1 Tax=Candidatus Hepatobacter penaei TaxID=1274402 RepID=UPI0009E1C5B0|nr:hypothetical protein [Candidatus Hepatobacter penaei]